MADGITVKELKARLKVLPGNWQYRPEPKIFGYRKHQVTVTPGWSRRNVHPTITVWCRHQADIPKGRLLLLEMVEKLEAKD